MSCIRVNFMYMKWAPCSYSAKLQIFHCKIFRHFFHQAAVSKVYNLIMVNTVEVGYPFHYHANVMVLSNGLVEIRADRKARGRWLLFGKFVKLLYLLYQSYGDRVMFWNWIFFQENDKIRNSYYCKFTKGHFAHFA